MKTTTIRRIFQIVFFALFVWFAVVTTFGEKFYQLRGWPVNWILYLDPLVGFMTLLTTRTLYAPLAWGLLTIALTILLGRFFCSWVCPFGTIHHFMGWLGKLRNPAAIKIRKNRYRRAQSIKYYILIVFLIMAAVPVAGVSLQAGLLDPIPLVTRSFHLFLLPFADNTVNVLSPNDRHFETAWLVLALFFTFTALNFVIPRFFCRFLCPTGALFGLINRFSIWRIGKSQNTCPDCRLCEKNCEGGCEPTRQIKWAECVLCFNCVDDCRHRLVQYQTVRSRAGEVTDTGVSRRGVLLSLAGGATALAGIRLTGKTGENWHHKIIRPPGSLEETEFLKRCLKCGQCMRVCPTNVIQPGSIEGGVENLWTPVLNNRIGTSGCQLNCTACGYVCPTSAIRPISLSEKLGINEFAEKGPIKLGTAFVDRSRCLPWAMDKPCIVCQENCPVSPKAIYTRDYYADLRGLEFTVQGYSGHTLRIDRPVLEPNLYATGDYHLAGPAQNTRPRFRILANTPGDLTLQNEIKAKSILKQGDKVNIQVRLQRPYIDIEKCIGCGVCEHECPVSGNRAIRVSAEGETRSHKRSLLLRG